MIKILDTTLREGEQSPSVTFTVEEKLKIADMLDNFGVNIIEAGHPIVSEDIKLAIKKITEQNYKAEILAHCRARKEDIDAAIECDVDWVGIFLCVSKQRLEQQFRSNLNKAIDQITDTISYAKDHGLKIRYTPEDTTRTEHGSLIKIIKAATNAGADRISIADTVGAMTPIKMYNFIKKIKTETNVKLNVHCHNDLGLATANSIAAYEAGASMIDVTINGIGERVGITPLSEICIALYCIYNVKNNWKLEMLPELSQKISEYTGIKISPNTPILGENAFSHKAGLHVAAVLQNPRYYEIIPIELIRRNRNFILDKMAGSQTIKQKIEQMGFSNDYDNTQKIMHYVKSKQKGTISEDEIISILHNHEADRGMFQ